MTPEEKLDEILITCRNRVRNHFELSVWQELARKICDDNDASISNPFFQMHIEKLKTDGNITDVLIHGSPSLREWISTHKGMFCELYTDAASRAISEREALEAETTQNKQNQTDLLHWNKKVALWTKWAVIVAALLLIWQILDRFVFQIRFPTMVKP